MNNEADATLPAERQEENGSYEAPKIESLMSPDDLAREVHYAGATDTTINFG